MQFQTKIRSSGIISRLSLGLGLVVSQCLATSSGHLSDDDCFGHSPWSVKEFADGEIQCLPGG